LSYAERLHGLELSTAQRARLEASFTELTAWPDSAAVLEQLRARGLKLAPLANFSPRMIARLLERSGLAPHFDARISTDRARTYKPDARAYALAEATFSLPRGQIAFSAFGGWDAAGARWFGFPTFWVNRLAQPLEELAAPDGVGADLTALVRWLERR
jgi:2-haloacid dehalogenase